MNGAATFAAIALGIILGIGLWLLDFVVVGSLTASMGPVDHARAAEGVVLQIPFLAALASLIVFGTRSAKRHPFLAATAITAAMIAVVPVGGCTLMALANAIGAAKS